MTNVVDWIERKIGTPKVAPIKATLKQKTGPRDIRDGLVIGKQTPDFTEYGTDLRIQIIKHVVIAAGPGSGKTLAMQIIVNEAGHCANARTTLIDLGSELAGYAAGPWARRVSDAAMATEVLASYRAQHHARLKVMAKTGAAAHRPTKADPMEIVVIDEMQMLVDAGLGDEVGLLMAMTRKTAIVFICAAPRGVEAQIPVAVRANAKCRIAMACKEPEQRYVLHNGGRLGPGEPLMESARPGELLVLGDGPMQHGRTFTIDMDRDERYPELIRRNTEITALRREWGCPDWGVVEDVATEPEDVMTVADACLFAVDLAVQALMLHDGQEASDARDGWQRSVRAIIAREMPDEMVSDLPMHDSASWSMRIAKNILERHFPHTGIRGTVATRTTDDPSTRGSSTPLGADGIDDRSSTTGCEADGRLNPTDSECDGGRSTVATGRATGEQSPYGVLHVARTTFAECGDLGEHIASIIESHGPITRRAIARVIETETGSEPRWDRVSKPVMRMAESGWVEMLKPSSDFQLTASGREQLRAENTDVVKSA